MSWHSIRRRGAHAWAVLAASLLLLPLVTSAGGQVRPAQRTKQVAAPAQDLLSGRLRLPDPSEVSIRSGSALVPVRFARTPEGRGTFEVQVPAEPGAGFALAAFAPDVERWSIGLIAPGSPAGTPPMPIESLVAAGAALARQGDLSPIAPAIRATRYDLQASPVPGVWTIAVARASPGGTTDVPAGWLLMSGGGPARLVSRLGTHALLAGAEISVTAWLESGTDDGGARVHSAVLDAQTPLGSLRSTLHDDGEHDDGAAGDGLYGTWLPAMPAGAVRARVIVNGIDGSGSPVLRSVQHAFPIVEPFARLEGGAAPSAGDAGRLEFALGLAPAGDPANGAPRKLQVSAELWGTDRAGQPIPVCWMSTMAIPETMEAGSRVRLSLDVDWLAFAEASTPLALRAVRLQDPDTHVLLDQLDQIALDERVVRQALADLVPTAPPAGQPTRAMLMGADFASSGAPDAPAAGSGTAPGTPPAPGVPTAVRWDGALMLVHGYCSSGAVWPQAHFTAPKLTFLDPNQSRSHDEFALLLQAFGAEQSSFGVVAHSQGGAAALHLYTFYESGLDHALGERLIQSVATPYAGTPLAGNLAIIGQIFGSGCGENFDMTANGSALWLSTIPTWARARVHYWTTSDGGSACNFLTNLFLDNPEDGVVEMAKGQLPGAQSMGHKTGWCHTTGMSYPANYGDAARNLEMNAAAAR